MKHREPQSGSERTAISSSPTLADVLSRLSVEETVSATRRRDLMSAVRSMGRIVSTPLEQVPASPRLIRERLKGLEPAEVGLSAKRFANIKSDALSALRLVGAVDVSVSRSLPMTPEWERLWRAINNEQRRWKLSRFFRYCSEHAIPPEAVDDTVLSSFHKSIEDLSFTKDPDGHLCGVIWAWNRCREEIPDWPSQRLAPLHTGPRGWTLQIADFPQSFQQDQERLAGRLRGDDPFAEDALERIRLHGIDAPESGHKCRRQGVPWLCGAEASQLRSTPIRE